MSKKSTRSVSRETVTNKIGMDFGRSPWNPETSESGGGTTVIPNPQSTGEYLPLETLSIDGVNYYIEANAGSEDWNKMNVPGGEYDPENPDYVDDIVASYYNLVNNKAFKISINTSHFFFDDGERFASNMTDSDLAMSDVEEVDAKIAYIGEDGGADGLDKFSDDVFEKNLVYEKVFYRDPLIDILNANAGRWVIIGDLPAPLGAAFVANAAGAATPIYSSLASGRDENRWVFPKKTSTGEYTDVNCGHVAGIRIAAKLYEEDDTPFVRFRVNLLVETEGVSISPANSDYIFNVFNSMKHYDIPYELWVRA